MPGSPSSEICNGVDDDCDGTIDDGLDCRDDDGDTVPNATDNCPSEWNPSQADWNGNGVGNVCDLADGMIYILSGTKSTVRWAKENGPTRWNLYAGDLALLRTTGLYTQPDEFGPLVFRYCGTDQTSFDNPAEPDEGTVQFFLVTGMTGGVEGNLGTNSAGVTRPNANPCQ